MTHATLGFIYTPSLDHVLLINKKRPAWQAGKINGLGGKVESGESGIECIAREVEEETGMKILAAEWKSVGEIHMIDWEVDIFATVYEGIVSDIKSMTNEIVEWFPVKKLPHNIMSNLSWLIPLGIDILSNSNPPQVTVEYSSD